MQPSVSVIISVYNIEKHLEKCLDSVIGQTLKDIEIIVVNDGSTDNSLDIITQYARKDSRIVIVDKAFLLGFEDGTPDWDASEYQDFQHYPSVQWKLLNIRKLKRKNPQKHEDGIIKLQNYFGF